MWLWMLVIVVSEESVRGVTISVVKTRPDRPVGPIEPGTGQVNGSVDPENRTKKKPVLNRLNRYKTEKTGMNRGRSGSERF